MLITPKMLYNYAVANGLQNAPIRICDGMAVSYFPEMKCLGRSTSTVIDLSTIDPIEFDELTPLEQRVTYCVPVK
ncbi:MAG: hypothetical protein IIU85_06295 [Rikenellaceae bacterium]|nr:hypothetical protein [Rikenellaceae bacterium]